MDSKQDMRSKVKKERKFGNSAYLGASFSVRVNVRKGNDIFIFIKMQQASKSENRTCFLMARSIQNQMSGCIPLGAAGNFSSTDPALGM